MRSWLTLHLICCLALQPESSYDVNQSNPRWSNDQKNRDNRKRIYEDYLRIEKPMEAYRLLSKRHDVSLRSQEESTFATCDPEAHLMAGCQDCELTCNTRYGKPEKNCTKCDEEEPGCMCMDGYLKDTRLDKCVASTECSCNEDPNAVFGCSHCLQECAQMYELPSMYCVNECTDMECICKEGYYLHTKINQCVDANDCDCDEDPNTAPGCQDCSHTCNVRQGVREENCPPCDSDVPGCRCRDAYLKDTTRGVCVLAEDCSCHWDPHTIIGCFGCARTCVNMFIPLEDCAEGCKADTCICREGFFNYTSENKCVESNDCPCGEDTHATPGCQLCNLTCDGLYGDTTKPCSSECNLSERPCKCKKGYARDTTREICVVQEDCSCNGDPQAVVGCSACSRKCDAMFKQLDDCVLGCTIDTCICRIGYFYDAQNKKCVIAEDCSCGSDPNATPGCQDCEQTCNAMQHKREPSCEPCESEEAACKCRLGYVFDTAIELCVKLQDCSCDADPNAIFGCHACMKSCDRMFDPMDSCKSGCFVDTCICRNDYFNDTLNMKCVVAEDCTCGDDPNATPGCQDCKQTCNAMYDKAELNCTACDAHNPGCKCKKDFVKDTNLNQCVQRKDCSCSYDPNTVHGCQDCMQTCFAVIGEPDNGKCPPCDEDNPGCKCRRGYLKDTSRDMCVRTEDCSCNEDPNAIVGCIFCLAKCETSFIMTARNCVERCPEDEATHHCICRPGYFLESGKDQCVEEENCPCGPDPMAKPGCQDCDLTCHALHGEPEHNCNPCDSNNPGCMCKRGYVKDTTRDVCVKNEDCSCGGDVNGRYGCAVCFKTCETMFDTLKSCKVGCFVDSCICGEGFFNDTKKNMCVEANDCACGPDPNATPGCQQCNLTCNALQNKPETNCPVCDEENPGCKCKRGYVKDTRWDMCVKSEECSCSDDPNAVYGCHDCKNTCDQLYGRRTAEPCPPCDEGNPGCKCRSGLVKDTTRNLCVKQDECSCNGDPKAVIGCIYCLLRCDTMLAPRTKHCKEQCPEAEAFDSCICQDGFFLDNKTGLCVIDNDCSCGEDPNAMPGCQDCKLTCNSVYGKPEENCSNCDINSYNPGCKCKSGFVKDTTRDMCILRKECSCNGDPNAVVGCSVCLSVCDEVLHPVNRTCPKGCFVNSCVCREGYLLDTDNNKCRLPNDCPCGDDPHATLGCEDCTQTCNQLRGRPETNCSPCVTSKPGCRCRDGYVKDTRYNRCVKGEECPCGDDPHAVHGCQDCNETCNVLTGNLETKCTPCDAARPGCKCLRGYVKDTQRDKCVRLEDCYDHKASMHIDEWSAVVLVLSVAAGLLSFGALFALLWYGFRAIIKPEKADLPLSCSCDVVKPPSESSCECE